MWVSSLSANLAKKIASLWYFKATLRIRIVVQGSAQSFGKMYYMFTPRVNNVMTQRGRYHIASGQYHNCEIVPHLVVDPSKNDTYEIDLPICSPTGWYQLGTTIKVPPVTGTLQTHGSYQLERFMLNQILSGTAQAGTCNICMYMSLVDPEFEGLTTGLSSDFVEEKKASDYVSTVANMSAQIVPFAGEFAPEVTLFSAVTGTLASVLRWFGFSKPPASEHHTFITNRNCDNYSQIEGTSTAMVLASSQKQGISINPAFGAGTLDDMAIASLCAKQSLVYAGTITSASAAEAALSFYCRVSPMIAYTYTDTTHAKSYSPMAMFCELSNFWCGDITFRIEFVASVFTRASILIAWDPFNYSGTPPSFADAVSILKNVTVQVVGNTAVDLTIPYKSYMPALTSGQINLPNSAGSESTDNGMIFFYVINPVQDNGSATPTMYMNVYARSHNMTFLAPSLDTGFDNTFQTEAYSDDFCPSAKVSFGEKTDLSMLSKRVIGDEPRSVKDYALRMGDIYRGTSTLQFSPSYKNNSTTFGGNLPMFNNQSLVWGLNHNNMFGIISTGYLGYRGSIRWSAKSTYSNGTTSGLPRIGYTAIHYDYPGVSTSTLNTTTDTLLHIDPGPAYAFTHAVENVSERIDFTCPLMVPTDFLPTQTLSDVTNDYFFVMSSVYGVDTALNTGNVVTTLYQGCGDDGVFLWFLGFPKTNN